MALAGAFGQNMSQRKGREDTGQEKERRGPHGAYGERQGEPLTRGSFGKGKVTPSASGGLRPMGGLQFIPSSEPA